MSWNEIKVWRHTHSVKKYPKIPFLFLSAFEHAPGRYLDLCMKYLAHDSHIKGKVKQSNSFIWSPSEKFLEITNCSISTVEADEEGRRIKMKYLMESVYAGGTHWKVAEQLQHSIVKECYLTKMSQWDPDRMRRTAKPLSASRCNLLQPLLSMAELHCFQLTKALCLIYDSLWQWFWQRFQSPKASLVSEVLLWKHNKKSQWVLRSWKQWLSGMGGTQ